MRNKYTQQQVIDQYVTQHTNDINSLRSGTLVPPYTGDTTMFLRADGVWFAPEGGGSSNIDGGNSNSNYLLSQIMDGGTA